LVKSFIAFNISPIFHMIPIKEYKRSIACHWK
jgi:hypothetical protein